MRALRIKHMEVLLAVAAAGSMQRAAEVINLTQPAISKLIGEIEAMFGTALFRRSKLGVTLTESGQALVERVQFLLNDLAHTQAEIAAIDRGMIGCLRIGALPVAECAILPQSLRTLHQQAPALRIQIEEGTRSALLALLRRGEIDCVIGRLDVGSQENGLYCEPLVQLPVLLVTAVNHPLASRQTVTLEDLTAYPWVLPRIGAPIRTVIDALFVNAGLAKPMPLIESTSIWLNQELLEASDLIGVMSKAAATSYASQGRLAILPINVSENLPQVGVMMRQAPASRAMSAFLTVLREQTGAPPPGPLSVLTGATLGKV